MIYTCKLCNKQYTDKSNFNKHTNRKNSCIKEENKCTICNKIFTTLFSLQRHLNKKIQCNTKEYYKCPDCDKRYLDKQSYKLHIKSHYDPTINQQMIINNNNTTNNNNNTTNNITNINITLPFGKENIDFLENIESITKILNEGFNCMKQLIKDKHYNKHHPENHNVFISDLRGKKTSVFTGDQWEFCHGAEIINKLQFLNIPHIRRWYDNYKDNLSKEPSENVKKLINSIKESDGTFSTTKETMHYYDKYNLCKKEIEELMYNGGKLIKELKKQKRLK
jgi:hypothetical protein